MRNWLRMWETWGLAALAVVLMIGAWYQGRESGRQSVAVRISTLPVLDLSSFYGAEPYACVIVPREVIEFMVAKEFISEVDTL